MLEIKKLLGPRTLANPSVRFIVRQGSEDIKKEQALTVNKQEKLKVYS